jgi:hypothetical protein
MQIQARQHLVEGTVKILTAKECLQSAEACLSLAPRPTPGSQPRVPGIHALLEQCDVLVVRHQSIPKSNDAATAANA